jgi:inhibitor of cysteine peptidase
MAMKKLFVVLAALCLLAMMACSGGGGGDEQISKNELKIAVGETSDGTSVVAADTDGNSLINKLDSKALVLMKANSKDNIVIYYGDNNLPVKAIIGEYIILYSNWTTNTVDLAIISPDKTYTIKRNLQVDSSIISSIQNAQKSANFKSSIHSASYKTTSADLLSELNISSDIISVGLCGVAIASSIADAGALVPWACTSLVLKGIAALTESNLAPAKIAWDSTTGIIDAIGGCTDELSCAAHLFGLGVDAINLAQTTASNNSSVINQAQNALSNTSGYTISGTVSGAVVSGVTMTLTGNFASYAPVQTDSAGYYIFTNIANGNYTVTPSKTGYSFSPSSAAVTISGADKPNINFTATASTTPTYTISGTVSGAVASGVTITLSGTGSASTTTDPSGNYSFSSAANGNYTVTPSKTGYTFSPTNNSITVNNANVTGKNFTATASTTPTYTISGTVSGAVASGVTITLNGTGSSTTTTNSSGNYSFSGAANGNYTVTPSLTGYTFSPVNRTANVSGANFTVPDFVATATTALSITTTALPSATVGTGYAQGVEKSGGQTPYTWSVSSGLPSGLNINSSTGAIYGTPNASGTFSFTVTVRDSSSPQQTYSKVLSLTVTPVNAAMVDNGNGTVTDRSGLMWQKATAPGTYTWQQALSYCENLSLAGYTDWRLPNFYELQSLVDNSHYNPAIDPLLAPYTVSDFYWSSSDTIYPSDPDTAWFVDFQDGWNYISYKYNSYYVRAVRTP